MRRILGALVAPSAPASYPTLTTRRRRVVYRYHSLAIGRGGREAGVPKRRQHFAHQVHQVLRLQEEDPGSAPSPQENSLASNPFWDGRSYISFLRPRRKVCGPESTSVRPHRELFSCGRLVSFQRYCKLHARCPATAAAEETHEETTVNMILAARPSVQLKRPKPLATATVH